MDTHPDSDGNPTTPPGSPSQHGIYDTKLAGSGDTTVTQPRPTSGTRRSVITVVAAASFSALAAAGSTFGVLQMSSANSPSYVTPATVASAQPVSLTSSSTSMASLLAKVEPGVVTISTTGFASYGRFGVQQEEGAGTGMVLTADGIILTNAHVVADASTISVKIPGDDATYSATVLGSNADRDVAVLKLTNASGLTPVVLGSSSDMAVGDDVVAIGNALALPGGPTVTTGIVSALDRSISDSTTTLSDLIQTDAAINPGNSGGPLVNTKGEVIAMNTAVSSDGQNIGFALSIDSIKELITQLENGEGSDRLTTSAQNEVQTTENPYSPFAGRTGSLY